MKLNKEIFHHLVELQQNGFDIPKFDYDSMCDTTEKEPTWIHFGAGNIFRSFLGSITQNLLNSGITNKGVIVVEGYDYEIIDLLNKYDKLSINVTLKQDGDKAFELLAPFANYLKLDTANSDYQILEGMFENPTLQMISFTITEKGYSITGRDGYYFDEVLSDFSIGPSDAKSYLGKIVALLYKRYQAGKLPLALVSMDNMSENGLKLEKVVLEFANHWVEAGKVEAGFLDYLTNRKQITFPWSMIDKITPSPNQLIQTELEELGLESLNIQKTSKNSQVSPFVNSEEIGYLVIEDTFPNGRPPLDKAGVMFTERKVVNQIETMKVTTCLNPLHTALSIFARLLEYDYVFEAMKDNLIEKLVSRLSYDEGMKVVVDPVIINPEAFLKEVIEVRFPNPYIPDSPVRILSDTSQKLPVRFGETVKAYISSPELDVKDLQIIPLVYAGWLRYLAGVSDKGNVYELSPDPLISTLHEFTNRKIGNPTDGKTVLNLLQDTAIFGVDLVEFGLADSVVSLYQRMMSAENAVLTLLQERLG